MGTLWPQRMLCWEPSMSRSILIVDDDPRIRTSLSQALRDESTGVRTAETGEDAVEFSVEPDESAEADLSDSTADGEAEGQTGG